MLLRLVGFIIFVLKVFFGCLFHEIFVFILLFHCKMLLLYQYMPNIDFFLKKKSTILHLPPFSLLIYSNQEFDKGMNYWAQTLGEALDSLQVLGPTPRGIIAFADLLCACVPLLGYFIIQAVHELRYLFHSVLCSISSPRAQQQDLPRSSEARQARRRRAPCHSDPWPLPLLIGISVYD
jgi:hypothetical protein